MEKIYMENNNKSKKPSFFKKFFNDKGSMTVIVVVAIVGILSLMVFGFNQISFAADLNGTLPDGFESALGQELGKNNVIGQTRSDEMGIVPINGFYTTDGTPFFCIESNIDYLSGKQYSSSSEITDNGLIYLMANLYPNKVFKDANGVDLPEGAQMWLTQTAVWSYLYQIGAEGNDQFESVNSKVWDVSILYNNDNPNGIVRATGDNTLYEEYGIDALINSAISIHNGSQSIATFAVNKQSDNISITNDNKYYQSDLISVVGNVPVINNFKLGDYESYSVDLSKAPQGTVLVDESGNVYDDVTNMAPTAKFYVRIPVDKVTDENKNVQISILGNFQVYGANKYVATGSQSVINVKILGRSFSKPLDIQLDYTPEVPNTGMSTAQIIYFIGLIILLSGVGILYANAKPEGSK